MAGLTDNLSGIAGLLERRRGLLAPMAAAALVFVILVPLPPGLVDLLLVCSLALAALILLTAMRVPRPLDFSVLPTLLLGMTLFRLVLNVATTRLILTAGRDGAAVDDAALAAGGVIWTFSEFVTAGSLAVGLILFAILVVVQFVVVTKGAGRISEVAARFVLDAMPGKQMAVDADLSAGLISDEQARGLRKELSRQADFYGAMDGASKFLRGDAVAGVLITFVNLLGGCYVGMVQYGWSWSETVNLFTRLTIGDGLVTQIPAFIVSVAAAITITRPAEERDLGEDLLSQLGSRPAVLVLTAVFLGALALTSLPKVPLLLIGAGCAGLAWMLRRRARAAPQRRDSECATNTAADRAENLTDLLAVEPMQIEMGYALVRLVNQPQEGALLERVAALRKRVATELGLIVPPIKISDNLQLGAHTYVIRIRGAQVASGKVYPSQFLALSDGDARGELVGREATDPIGGLPGVWISANQRPRAEALNHTVVDAGTVLMTHLAETIHRHGADLLTREQVAEILDALGRRCPTLVGDVRAKFDVGRVQAVLQNLLRERAAIRDMVTILEAMAANESLAADVDLLTERVRSALRRTLSQQHCGRDGKLRCVSLAPEVEDALCGQFVSDGAEGEIGRKAARALGQSLSRLRKLGHDPVVLCGPAVRRKLRGLLAAEQPEAAVLATSEIDAVEVEPLERVGVEP